MKLIKNKYGQIVFILQLIELHTKHNILFFSSHFENLHRRSYIFSFSRKREKVPQANEGGLKLRYTSILRPLNRLRHLLPLGEKEKIVARVFLGEPP